MCSSDLICVSNTDDHLRNHGFLLSPGKGWRLAPAYDMNPEPLDDALRLNIHGNDNTLNLDLAREAAALYRVTKTSRDSVIEEVTRAVRRWPQVSRRLGLGKSAQEQMAAAFRLASG